MNIKFTTTVTAALLLLNSIAYCHSELSYEDTVNLIKETMTNSTSYVRSESYGYISFNKCSMDYNAIGSYSVDNNYNKRYSNIDFSSLNHQLSRVGCDYTNFVILNFNKDIQYRDDFRALTVHSVVINVSTNERAKILYKAFLHLGELCGAK